MMEFEEEHEEEEEEEEEEDEMAITPTFRKQQNNNNSNQTPPTSTSSTTVRYRECLKNHAVGIGGHAVDGCGEFLPAGSEGSIDALRCAACNCHRNFHRKEYSNSVSSQLALYTTPRPPPHHHPHHPHQVYQFYPYNRTSAGYLHVSGSGGPGQRQQLALPSPTSGGAHNTNNNQQEEVVGGGGGGGEQMMMMMMSGGNNSNVAAVGGGGTMSISGGTTLSGGNTSSGKKRFRTKFTADQKDKMLALAERLGWRIQKQDEELVQQFCHETGIKRHVLKVWMHNNKLTLGKKTLITTPSPTTTPTPTPPLRE